MRRSALLLTCVVTASACASEVEPYYGSGPAPSSTSPAPPKVPAPGPEVVTASPSSGSWGTLYTIEGTHLDVAPYLSFATKVGEPVTLTKTGRSIVSWTSTKIVVKVPFPADGEVKLAGEAVGTFDATHAVTKAFKRNEREPYAVMSTAPGELVVAATQRPGTTDIPLFVRVSAKGVTELSGAFDRAWLFRDNTEPFAIVTTGGVPSYRSLATDDDVTTPIADLPAKPIIGNGADATGAYVWLADGATVTRYRRDTGGAWASDRSITSAAPGIRALASTDDGTLALFSTTHGGGLFDDYDNVWVQETPSNGGAFTSTSSIDHDVDDSTFGYRTWAKDGGHFSLRYCATDEGANSFDNRICYYWSKTPDTAWTSVAFLQFSGGSADAAVATCETDDVLSVTGKSGKQTVLHPCRDVAGFAVDESGGVLLLAAYEGNYYLASPKK